MIQAQTLPDDHTAMKLSRALTKAGLLDMAARAATGWYHDYLSPLDLPEMQLLQDLNDAITLGNVAAIALRARHMNGDFDASFAESEAWARSEDGQAAFSGLSDDARRALGDPTINERTKK